MAISKQWFTAADIQPYVGGYYDESGWQTTGPADRLNTLTSVDSWIPYARALGFEGPTKTQVLSYDPGEGGGGYVEVISPEFKEFVNRAKGAGYDLVISNIHNRRGEFGLMTPTGDVIGKQSFDAGNFSSMIRDLAPIALSALTFGGAGAALGQAIAPTLSATTQAAIGNALISGGTTALGGGDAGDVLRSAVIAGSSPYVSEALASPIGGADLYADLAAADEAVRAGDIAAGMDLFTSPDLTDPYAGMADLVAPPDLVTPPSKEAIPFAIDPGAPEAPRMDMFSFPEVEAPLLTDQSMMPVVDVPTGGADLYADLAEVTPPPAGGADLYEDLAAADAAMQPADPYADLAQAPPDDISGLPPVVDRSIPYDPTVQDTPLGEALLDLGEAGLEYAIQNPFTTAAAISGVAALTDAASGEKKDVEPEPVKKTYTYGTAGPTKRTGLKEIKSAAADIYGPQGGYVPPPAAQAPSTPPAYQYVPAELLQGQAPGAQYGLGALSQMALPETFDIGNLTPRQIAEIQRLLTQPR